MTLRKTHMLKDAPKAVNMDQFSSAVYLPGFCLLGLRCWIIGNLNILVTMSCIPIDTSGSDTGLFWRPLCVGLRLIHIPMDGYNAPGWGPAGPVPTCSCLQSHAYVSMHTKMKMNARLVCNHEASMKPACDAVM